MLLNKREMPGCESVAERAQVDPILLHYVFARIHARLGTTAAAASLGLPFDIQIGSADAQRC
jgi:hypothetical protein